MRGGWRKPRNGEFHHFCTSLYDIYDLKETGCEGVNWSHLSLPTAQRLALVNTAINMLGSIKGRESLSEY